MSGKQPAPIAMSKTPISNPSDGCGARKDCNRSKIAKRLKSIEDKMANNNTKP